MRISDWSSDVCSSDLLDRLADRPAPPGRLLDRRDPAIGEPRVELDQDHFRGFGARAQLLLSPDKVGLRLIGKKVDRRQTPARSEERRVGKERARTCRSRWLPDT